MEAEETTNEILGAIDELLESSVQMDEVMLGDVRNEFSFINENTNELQNQGVLDELDTADEKLSETINQIANYEEDNISLNLAVDLEEADRNNAIEISDSQDSQEETQDSDIFTETNSRPSSESRLDSESRLEQVTIICLEHPDMVDGKVGYPTTQTLRALQNLGLVVRVGIAEQMSNKQIRDKINVAFADIFNYKGFSFNYLKVVTEGKLLEKLKDQRVNGDDVLSLKSSKDQVFIMVKRVGTGLPKPTNKPRHPKKVQQLVKKYSSVKFNAKGLMLEDMQPHVVIKRLKDGQVRKEQSKTTDEQEEFSFEEYSDDDEYSGSETVNDSSTDGSSTDSLPEDKGVLLGTAIGSGSKGGRTSRHSALMARKFIQGMNDPSMCGRGRGSWITLKRKGDKDDPEAFPPSRKRGRPRIRPLPIPRERKPPGRKKQQTIREIVGDPEPVPKGPPGAKRIEVQNYPNLINESPFVKKIRRRMLLRGNALDNDHHPANRIKCKFCGDYQKTMLHLYQHLAIKHPNNNHFYECQECGTLFKTAQDMENHAMRHTLRHAEVIYQIPRMGEAGKYLYNCPVFLCEKKYLTWTKLVNHLYYHKSKDCLLCGERIHPCPMKVYCSHVSMHVEGGPYVCPKCPKTFFSKIEQFRNHMKLMHGATESSWSCRFCFKQFETFAEMDMHLLGWHTNRPYICQYCGKEFQSFLTLEHHMESHDRGFAHDQFFQSCCESFRSQANKKPRIEVSTSPVIQPSMSKQIQVIRRDGTVSIVKSSEDHPTIGTPISSVRPKPYSQTTQPISTSKPATPRILKRHPTAPVSIAPKPPKQQMFIMRQGMKATPTGYQKCMTLVPVSSTTPIQPGGIQIPAAKLNAILAGKVTADVTSKLKITDVRGAIHNEQKSDPAPIVIQPIPEGDGEGKESKMASGEDLKVCHHGSCLHVSSSAIDLWANHYFPKHYKREDNYEFMCTNCASLYANADWPPVSHPCKKPQYIFVCADCGLLFQTIREKMQHFTACKYFTTAEALMAPRPIDIQKCQYCLLMCSSLAELSVHLLQNHVTKRFATQLVCCEQCSIVRRFLDVEHLWEHNKVVHKEWWKQCGRWLCTHCGIDLTTEQEFKEHCLYTHAAYSHPRIFCSFCLEIFVSKSDFDTHSIKCATRHKRTAEKLTQLTSIAPTVIAPLDDAPPPTSTATPLVIAPEGDESARNTIVRVIEPGMPSSSEKPISTEAQKKSSEAHTLSNDGRLASNNAEPDDHDSAPVVISSSCDEEEESTTLRETVNQTEEEPESTPTSSAIDGVHSEVANVEQETLTPQASASPSRDTAVTTNEELTGGTQSETPMEDGNDSATQSEKSQKALIKSQPQSLMQSMMRMATSQAADRTTVYIDDLNCQKCDEPSHSFEALRDHVRSAHKPEDKLLTCPCPDPPTTATLKWPHKYWNHCISVHGKWMVSFKLACTSCGELFKSNKDMQYHQIYQHNHDVKSISIRDCIEMISKISRAKTSSTSPIAKKKKKKKKKKKVNLTEEQKQSTETETKPTEDAPSPQNISSPQASQSAIIPTSNEKNNESEKSPESTLPRNAEDDLCEKDQSEKVSSDKEPQTAKGPEHVRRSLDFDSEVAKLPETPTKRPANDIVNKEEPTKKKIKEETAKWTATNVEDSQSDPILISSSEDESEAAPSKAVDKPTVAKEAKLQESKNAKPQESSLTNTNEPCKKLTESPATMTESTTKESQEDSKVHPCPQCGKTLPDLPTLKRHQRIEHPTGLIKCEKCKQRVKIVDIESHICVTEDNSVEPIFPCEFCMEKFNYLAAKNRHIATNHRSQLKRCMTCGKAFVTKDTLDRHIERMHPAAFRRMHETDKASPVVSVKAKAVSKIALNTQETSNKPPEKKTIQNAVYQKGKASSNWTMGSSSHMMYTKKCRYCKKLLVNWAQGSSHESKCLNNPSNIKKKAEESRNKQRVFSKQAQDYDNPAASLRTLLCENICEDGGNDSDPDNSSQDRGSGGRIIALRHESSEDERDDVMFVPTEEPSRDSSTTLPSNEPSSQVSAVGRASNHAADNVFGSEAEARRKALEEEVFGPPRPSSTVSPSTSTEDAEAQRRRKELEEEVFGPPKDKSYDELVEEVFGPAKSANEKSSTANSNSSPLVDQVFGPSQSTSTITTHASCTVDALNNPTTNTSGDVLGLTSALQNPAVLEISPEIPPDPIQIAPIEIAPGSDTFTTPLIIAPSDDTSNGAGPYSCTFCDKTYEVQCDLEIHRLNSQHF